MPSYLRNPYRSYSYPPTLEGIEEDYENNLPDIDEDPFAHFITPIDDEDPYDMSLSAGIMVADGPRASKASKFKFNVADKWTRYIKQSHTGLHKQHHTTTIVEEEEDEDEEESFMGLDDARLNERPSPTPELAHTVWSSSFMESSEPGSLHCRRVGGRRASCVEEIEDKEGQGWRRAPEVVDAVAIADEGGHD
ncbi:hypothetical protein SNOG_03252 [Parastagonospora nodorum SN15]|uniref:Uncharacterized protein n=1 Tax=Phaeosphaeria nodorum (strain SN15 / ATCC MYA-4574 / FGSC 10173) TaxID=321614 RepID=Q0UYB2_PHANO|nr:hypothetical protein SNOG_03252 [Parastagonospora nodorum SN15]EAT89983.2 hypothetical protein SNOG_03252 [Parastagonospora nodorum SN15]